MVASWNAFEDDCRSAVDDKLHSILTFVRLRKTLHAGCAEKTITLLLFCFFTTFMTLQYNRRSKDRRSESLNRMGKVQEAKHPHLIKWDVSSRKVKKPKGQRRGVERRHMTPTSTSFTFRAEVMRRDLNESQCLCECFRDRRLSLDAT